MTARNGRIFGIVAATTYARSAKPRTSNHTRAKRLSTQRRSSVRRKRNEIGDQSAPAQGSSQHKGEEHRLKPMRGGPHPPTRRVWRRATIVWVERSSTTMKLRWRPASLRSAEQAEGRALQRQENGKNQPEGWSPQDHGCAPTFCAARLARKLSPQMQRRRKRQGLRRACHAA